ncbi:MAG: acyl-CoA dehydrogenase family protein [Raineya sp.]
MNNTKEAISPKTTPNHPKNRVLEKDFRKSLNFYESDLMLRNYLKKFVSVEAHKYMEDKWNALGSKAAKTMDALSLLADKFPPQLIKRNHLGETLNEIQFHPAYHSLTQIAIDSEMFRVKWHPDLQKKFNQELHQLGFVSFFLFGMSEGGLPCPLCMTDGVARLIDLHCSQEDKNRLLPHIYADNLEELYTGAMFLTEKAGGSDVGANLVSATHWQGDYYLLNGEKWFCSNANAEIIFALARTNPEITGTKGLSIFLIEKQKPDGSPNPIEMVRLKDKLGVRSMASAECIFTDTVGKLIGKEGEGFKIMTDMINLSRLYNAVGSLSQMRRALAEVYQFLSFRNSFGKKALEHSLIRAKLNELAAIYTANFYMVWEAIAALDASDNNDEEKNQLLRLLTPMLKKTAAEAGVYVIREAMELMGGLGYIEDGIMPKLMRDTMVLPIWEGAGNIMILDMLRASLKSKGLEVMMKQIYFYLQKDELLLEELRKIEKVVNILPQNDQDTLEFTAKQLFERLAKLYQIALLKKYEDQESKNWTQAASEFLANTLQKQEIRIATPPHQASIEAMLAWKF